MSGWVTDIPVIDNTAHEFDPVVGSESRSSLTLSDVLGLLSRRGTKVHVAVRDVPHNWVFADRLTNSCDRSNLSVYSSPELHEKIMIGWDWVLKGSMNFTWNGTQLNEEAMDFEVGTGDAARQRLEVRTRWIGSQA
ncbi:hypothetical protein GP2_055_00190 [Gordonia paraffinivorans NBRC 108238]|uniref:Phospholipase D-like domain-containing protein n=1 Tax=Gordonia paraffinivorans NBRC 108238 TaxID=1223543 RepID=A0ABQ0IRI4_9ACTN|nr:hypothetical protein GP2_055_00190 [Gordonia paraffinivorans NBRC 108238]